MNRIDTEIVIAGAGLAGLAAACRLGAEGRRVAIVDPAPETQGPESRAAEDLRTTAYLAPGVATLTRGGVWQAMAADAAPLHTMRLVDAGGAERVPRTTADFRSQDIHTGPFGWNLANGPARAALRDRVAELETVQLIAGVHVTGWLGRSTETVIRLSDGRQISARLAIAADGRDSALRRLAGISARRWGYGQRALVFAVTHDAPHNGVSTEIHRTGGPLTLVPMPNRDGHPASSVVWMVPNARAARLMALSDAELGAELTAETMGLMGPLIIAGPRAAWPIMSQLAFKLCARRLALIAEAAHVIPPIGAQGLNMSLADIEALASLSAGKDDPGSEAVLAGYQRTRWPDMAARVAGVDLLNRAALAEAQPLRDLRRLGLEALHRITPLRQFAMRAGLGRGI